MSAPPRAARAFLTLLLPDEDREYVLHDLANGHRRWSVRGGRLAAWRWYWWQALRVIPAWWSLRREADLTGAALRLDVGGALRGLRRRPAHAAGVVGTLGIGLGAAAAMFAIANGVWFSPLPIPGSERLIRVYELNLRSEGGEEGTLLSTPAAAASPARWNGVSPPLLEDLRNAELTTIEGIGAISQNSYDWANGLEIRRVSAQMVSPELYELLGLRLHSGRLAGASAGVRELMLTRGFWQRIHGGDDRVIGRDAMVLDGESYAVVGVIDAPAGYPAQADIWVPLQFDEGSLSEGMRGARYLDAVARVRPGRTAAEAAAEVDGFVKRLADRHPQHRGWGGHALPLREDLVRPFRSVLLVLLVAGAAFVLLATVNVAGLVAARRAEGRHARSVRLALGATHAQILRSGLMESTLLGLGGAAAAGAGAYWVLAPVRRLIPVDVPRLAEVTIGPALLGSLLLAGLAAGLIAGLLGHAMSGVRDTPSIGRNRDADRPSVRGRRALLITQVALTTWLLVSGVALIRYVHGLRSIDVGFRAQDALTSFIALSGQRQGSSRERTLQFWDQVLQELDARGVRAAVANNPPISGSTMRYGYSLEGESSQVWAQYHAISDGYFDVLGIEMVEGRAFGADDRANGEPVIIVNEALARTHFGNAPAVGRTIRLLGTPRTIVGVARSTRHFGPDTEAPPELYVPLAQDPPRFAHVLIAAGASPPPPGVLDEVVGALDPQLLVPPLAPFETYIRNWFAPYRLQLFILGIFAAVGVLLAALGVYALVAYVVSSRVREIGIRVALGERTDVLFRRVIGQGLAMTAIGTAGGIVLAIMTSELVGRLIEGIEPLDPVVLLVVASLVATITVLASMVPARRAVRVDPIVALRSE